MQSPQLRYTQGSQTHKSVEMSLVLLYFWNTQAPPYEGLVSRRLRSEDRRSQKRCKTSVISTTSQDAWEAKQTDLLKLHWFVAFWGTRQSRMANALLPGEAERRRSYTFSFALAEALSREELRQSQGKGVVRSWLGASAPPKRSFHRACALDDLSIFNGKPTFSKSHRFNMNSRFQQTRISQLEK